MIPCRSGWFRAVGRTSVRTGPFGSLLANACPEPLSQPCLFGPYRCFSASGRCQNSNPRGIHHLRFHSMRKDHGYVNHVFITLMLLPFLSDKIHIRQDGRLTPCDAGLAQDSASQNSRAWSTNVRMWWAMIEDVIYHVCCVELTLCRAHSDPFDQEPGSDNEHDCTL